MGRGVRLVSWNVNGFGMYEQSARRMERLGGLMRWSRGCDVVGLQETRLRPGTRSLDYHFPGYLIFYNQGPADARGSEGVGGALEG